jgi:hypothetical protein
MPIATRPEPIAPSATAGGVRLDPVKGNGFVDLTLVGVDGRSVVVETDVTAVVVDPKPVTGVVAVLVVDASVVGGVGGTVVVGASVVVDTAVDDGVVLGDVLVDELVDELVEGEAVELGEALVVVTPGTQSESSCSCCADPPPSDDDHESLACTTCVPGPTSMPTASVPAGPVTVKSRSTTVLPSTVTVSWAVVDASASPS